MENKRRINISYGLLCLLLGGLWLLYTMGRLPDAISDYVFSWRFMLIVIGLFIIIKDRRSFFGLLLMAGGIIFSVADLWQLPDGWENYLPPSALIFVGLILLLRPSGEKKNIDPNDVNAINRATIFGDYKHQVTSILFKGGFLTAVFGANTVNFTKAHLGADEVFLHITSVFGSNVIVVPEHWDVKLETVSILGSSDDQRFVSDAVADKEGTLIVKGTVLFGDFKVRN